MTVVRLRERSHAEKQAYLDGYRAALKLITERHKLHSGENNVLLRACIEEGGAIANLIEETLNAEIQS